jgi:hypothetical protein
MSGLDARAGSNSARRRQSGICGSSLYNGEESIPSKAISIVKLTIFTSSAINFGGHHTTRTLDHRKK